MLVEGAEGGGGSYSHFPAQILTKSQCAREQIPSSQWLSCSNLNPIPIFYCFFCWWIPVPVHEIPFSHPKISKSQFPFYPFRTLLVKCNTLSTNRTKRNSYNYGIVTSLLAHIIWIKMRTPIRFLLYWISHISTNVFYS
jgi:hypothetical protein